MKTKYILTVLLSMSLFVSCYDDQGNYDYESISDIEIASVEDKYIQVSGSDILTITPELTTDYDDLEYMWLLYEDVDGENDERDTIGRERNLEYPIFNKPGDYKLYYSIKSNTNNYFVHKFIDLTVVTEYSQGFYILKETADGNTDMDMYNHGDKYFRNIIQNTQGNSLSGAPRSMGIMYQRPMIDTDKNKQIFANQIGIITYDNQVNIFRASDMSVAFDMNNLFFEEQEGVPYKFYIGYYNCSYMSNMGTYSVMHGQWGGGSGILGLPKGESGGSDHIACLLNSGNSAFWDETGKRMLRCDYNGAVHEIDNTYDEGGVDKTFDFSGCDCSFLGTSVGEVYGLFKNESTSQMYIGSFGDPDGWWTMKFTGIETIDPTLKLNSADLYASNEMSANFIYFIHGNKPYYYDITTKTETEIVFEGLPSDEEITLISNRYDLDDDNPFSYLTIATHKGGNYNVYMYKISGGLPSGAPEVTASGEGKVKEVHYLSSTTFNYEKSFSRI